MTGHAGSEPSKPFAEIRRISPNSTSSRASSCVVAPASTSPGAAACCSRAPTFTSAPITMFRSAAVPTATCPVFTPTRTRIGIVKDSSGASSSARSTTASAARIARIASSSRATGVPNTPRTASPITPSTTPPLQAISSATMPWNAASTSRNRSGSRRVASSVEPARSANTTDTTRRSDAAEMETGAPQVGQKFALGGSGSPQRGQVSGRIGQA
jgi:hypothetical protein